MYELKPISRDSIPRAIQKAERYRLLNQSWAAESICLDILEVDSENQQVLVMLVLALTDLHSGVAASARDSSRATAPPLTAGDRRLSTTEGRRCRWIS